MGQKCVLNRWLRGIVAGYIGLSGIARAEVPCIAVIYPQVREPYRAVLEEIMTGIEAGTDWTVERFPVKGSEINKGSGGLDSPSRCRAIIGLGHIGVQIATSFAPQVPVVAGAVLMQPGQDTKIPTVSFVPDSAEMFTRLKHFFPGIKTVTVVYDPAHSAGLVKEASKAAGSLGIRLNALEAHDLREAATLYENLLKNSDPKTDAIWLLRDTSVTGSRTILSLVLEHAWKRKLHIFSSQLSHVKRGVLFSVYPDNKKLGIRLARLAQQCATKACDNHGVMTLRELDTAVNIRTARRLGIYIDKRHDPYADLILPIN